MSKWEQTEFDGTNWVISNGKATISTFGSAQIHQLVPKLAFWNDSFSNIGIDFDLSGSGADKNFLLRYKSQGDFYELHFNDTVLALDRTVPSRSFTEQYIFGNGLTKHIHVDYSLSSIKVFVDGVLIAENQDISNPYSSGRIGLRIANGNSIQYDNIVVVGEDPTPSPTASPTASPTPSPTATPTPIPTATPTPTVTPSPTATPIATNSAFPVFTQTNSSWSGAIYDSANLWNPLDPSFGRWGCAVTSAAMILKYYGISTLPNGLGTTPGNLNLWLKQTPGGYVGDGLLNWTMISKISQIMRLTTPFGTKLEYSWGPGSVPLLTEELTSGRPTILQATLGHFVTAYQMGSANKIDIVDPFFPKTTLAEYGGTFVSMRKFTPSHTDLSHITLYLSGTADIDLFKRDGRRVNELNPAVYTEELWGQPGNQRSGPTSQVMDLAKPDSGRYRIRISKNSPKKLKYTLILTTKDGDQKILRGDVLAGRRPTYLDFNYFKIRSGDCFFEGLHDD